jgi:membrane protein DedA with SNARE-associated domain
MDPCFEFISETDKIDWINMETLLLQLSQLDSWKIGLIASYLLFQGVVFTIFPEEVIAVTLGLLWSQGKIGFVHAMVAIWIGLLPANATTVFVGGKFGPKLLSIRPFSWAFKKESVDEALGQVRKYGTWIVFVTRFIPVIRGPIYLATGLSQMGVRRFMQIDALASCIQLPCLLFLGRSIGQNVNSLMEGYRMVGVFMAVLLGSTIVFNWLYGRRKALLVSSNG